MRSRWLNRRAIGVHVTAVILIPTFLVLGHWQLDRALSGNALSWAYTFEWPIFAIYGTYMWWKLVHDFTPNTTNKPTDDAADTDVPQTIRPSESKEDAELASYNAYLAELHRADAVQNQGEST